jgi:hypothetical protein
MFGLVPPDFDLRRSTIDLLTEQAAAFYDYDEKKLFLLDDPALPAETTTLAHELAHALVDQHFDLQKYMEDSPGNDDENLAHSAVVEGQASWLMLAYELKKAGQPVAPTSEMLKSIVESGEASMADFPVLKAAPLYIQQSLLFPYSQGTAFFDSVYKRIGQQAFSAVFVESPVDTTQILHPDRYFAKERSTEPALPHISSESKAEEIAEGSVGEFDHRILLKQYAAAPQPDRLASHLRGGHFRIVGVGKDKQPVLEYSSQWDSQASAAEFFNSYRRVLKAKWKHCDVVVDNRSTFAGLGDNGYFVSRLIGEIASSVEGLSDVKEWHRLSHPTPVEVSARVR